MVSGVVPQPDPVAARHERADEIARLKLQFLASLNHEIRTPLSGILGMSDLLMETPLDTEQREYANAIHQCATALFRLLSNTLEYTSLVSGSVRLDEAEFNLKETLEAAVTEHLPAAQTKALDLRLRVHHSAERLVVGDPYRLRQVCSILLSNAVKFTPQGEVELAAHCVQQAARGLLLELQVIDSGIGMSGEQQQRIFDSFSQLEAGLTRRFEGMGLGLALARKLVELMGGSLELESEPGQGTVFVVRLPLGLAESAPLAVIPPARPSAARRILVVEDNRIAQQVISYVLSKQALPHDCVPDGWAALEAASRECYDLVLMDLQLPGLDGLETTARLRRQPDYARTPVLALTAESSDEMRHLCRQRGLDAFLTKPIQSADLIEALRQHLPGSQASFDRPAA